MTAVTFPVWDAPQFGAPWIDPVATQWSNSQLISVTLNRAQTNGKDDLPDLAVSTKDPVLPDTTHQGLVSKALLEFAPRLMAGTSPVRA